MNQTVTNLQQQFRQLRLAETADALPQILREAEKASWTYLEFLEAITVHEREKREEKSLERRMKWARFPFLKPLSEFKIDEQTALTGRQLKQLIELSWLEQHYNLILLGPPGVGKTFLAVGLGLEAVQRGYRVFFVTMGELVHLLKSEEFSNKSKVQLKRLRESDLVIIDDLMYMAMDQREANLFFHLINHLYERSSIILTSNKSPDQWGELIGDQGITTAILDRLLHRVEVIHSDDDSHRIRSVKIKRAENVKFYLTSTVHRLSSFQWHRNQQDSFPWINYFLSTILVAHKKLENRIGLLMTKEQNTNELIRRFVEGRITLFTKVDVRNACHEISEATINRILRALRDEGFFRTWQKYKVD